MILLPPDIRFALRANDVNRRAAQRDGKPEPDPVPMLKLFNPLGPATWLATELAEDDDALFGLADLGFGCPELGYFSLSEISSVRLPLGAGDRARSGFRDDPSPVGLGRRRAPLRLDPRRSIRIPSRREPRGHRASAPARMRVPVKVIL